MTGGRMRIALTVSLLCAIVMAALFCTIPYGLGASAQANSDGNGLSDHNDRLPAYSGNTQQVRTITIDELANLLKSNQSYVIVDTRSREDYDKAHLPGAVSVPTNLTDSYAGKFDRNRIIVTYCESFQYPDSTNSALEFMRLGFTNVWDYKGGISEWKDKGYPVYGK